MPTLRADTFSRKTIKSLRVERAAAKARSEAISEGLMAEVAAFNAALRAGREVRLSKRDDGSLCLGQRIEGARYAWDGLWVSCANYGGSFCLGNDSRWADLLKAAGVERDPRTV